MSGGDNEVDREAIYEEDPALQVLGRPVDPPDRRPVFADVVARTDNRKPIVPASMRSKEQRRTLYRWAVLLGGHTLLYHFTRTPKYALKVLWRAPIGAGRLTLKAWKWTVDWENMAIRQVPHVKGDYEGWSKLKQKSEARERLPIAGVVLVVSVLALCALGALAPWYAIAPAVALGMIVLARAGSPIGRPITDRVVAGPVVRKLTAELTRKAIMATGKVKDPAGIEFPQEIGRDGPGQRALVNLPDGVVATDIIDERDRLAAGFRLPKVQVWPATVPRAHPGQLEIWIADRPLDRMTPPAFPLLRTGQTDYFKAVPAGYDPRLRTQYWEFSQKNSLIAGIPGSGKSLDARVLLLAAVLDPLVIPAAFELKGTGDYRAIKPMCPEGMYGSGADEATKQAMFDFLCWLEDECDRRGPLVEKYTALGLNDTNNVNRAMAEKDARLRPLVAVLDEIQELFTDKELGKEAKAKATSIVKRGRALAIHLIPGTQRIDKESIPRGLSSNIALRACGAVTAHTECDLVLGTGAYSRGARPTEFETAVNDDPKDSGWVWRVGLGPMAPMRFYYVGNKQAEQIAARAMRMREDIAPVDVSAVKAQIYNLLDDVQAVWPAGQDQAWSEVLLRGLIQLRPTIYGEWTTDTLAKALKGHLITTAQTWGTDENGKGRNRRGIAHADLLAAITSQREGRQARQMAEIEAD